MNEIVIKIGELLVRAGIVTGVDLSEAEKLAKHMNLQFGQVLIMSGCLSDHDLDCALVAQQLIREELLTVDIACQALGLASQHQMPFEDALEALSVVPKYGAASVEMAELLADAGIIPGELLEEALMTSLTANVSLGELLVKENAISSALIPVLNMMLADIGSGALQEDQAINEIRKNHISWQRSQDVMNSPPMTQTPVMRQSEPPAAPVFVSQELMHAYEIYEPQQHHAQQQNSPVQPHPAQVHQPSPEPDQVNQPASPPYAEPTPATSQTHSIHDVLSMFQQRNPVPEGSAPAVPREQQAATWTAFVQSQSFDPNDVEPSVPPMAGAEEPRLRSLEEPSRSLEVVQGTYAKTFDGKSTELPETFEPIVPPDFEPAAEVIADGAPIKADTGAQSDAEDDEEDEDESENDEQFSLLVELLIESSYFDREDIIEAITNALKEESKAVKLIEMLGLADARAIMAASICADALRKNELTSGEAVTVLSDIKGGAEIHEALESVNLELAVTVSANLQMMFDDEVDETFYVGDVSRTVDIFEVDDFVEESRVVSKQQTGAPSAPPPVVEVKDELPPIAFGYGRERLKIAKRAEPQAEEKPVPPPIVEPVQAPAPVASKGPDRAQTTIGGKKVSSLSEVFEKLSGVEGNGVTATPAAKPVTPSPTPTPVTQKSAPAAKTGASPPTIKPVWDTMPASTITPVVDSIPAPTITPVLDATPAPTITPVVDATPAPVATEEPLSDADKKAARKRNSTTFNSLQAAFVPAAEALVTAEPATDELVAVSNEASDEYAAYVSNKPSDQLSALEPDAAPASNLEKNVDEHPVSDSDHKASEADFPVAVDSSKKKARSPKAKVRGGAKEKAATAAPKKTKGRK
ncbi:hypothetical protein BH10CYA1_BH10CYA1_42120 [soil metagenome]